MAPERNPIHIDRFISFILGQTEYETIHKEISSDSHTDFLVVSSSYWSKTLLNSVLFVPNNNPALMDKGFVGMYGELEIYCPALVCDSETDVPDCAHVRGVYA